ncbi:hypothetical protein [Streptomyces tritici]
MTRGNGLDLTVDHIHLSDRGAALLAGAAADWLRGGLAPRRRGQ